MPSLGLRVRCRPIRDDDRRAIVNLLLKSFRGDPEFWQEALNRLAEHATPPGFPKYGYLLEVNDVAVGMLLLISTSLREGGEAKLRCHVSSWTVWPAFRAYATFLATQALRHKEATYVNISAIPETVDILGAQGFTRYCTGRFTAVPALKLGSPRLRIAAATADMRPGDDLPADELVLLLKHAGYGCISLIATEGERRIPFVFEPMTRFRVVRTAYLVYCRSIDDFVRLAGPLGRFLAKRGYPFVAFDANGRVPGLIGRYAEATPRYFRGPDRPRLGDLAYSERAVLGLTFPPTVGLED
jgi:hypothetical protein